MNLLFLKLRVLIKIISAIFRIYRRAQFISAISQLYRRNSIYISDFPIISAQLNLYQRFPNYIGATQFISAISQLYQRLFKYIDLPTKPDNKKKLPNKYDGATSYFMLLYSFSALFFYDMPFFIPLYCTVICVMIKVNHAPFSAPYSTHFCLFSIDVIG